MSWSLTPKTRQGKQYLLCSNEWLGSIGLVITHPLFQRKEVSREKKLILYKWERIEPVYGGTGDVNPYHCYQ